MNSYQTIRFCPDCDNKFYHKVDDEQLMYYCRVCGKEDKDNSQVSSCVLNIQYNKEGSKPLEFIVNKYTKHDPTLPHINIPCPNEKCKSNKSNENVLEKFTDAVYIRYDNAHMRHLYLCTICDQTWKTNEI